MSSDSIILVTGATGQTGSKVVELLIQRGHRVRAMAHSADERAAKLEVLGAQVAVGDLLDPVDLELALKGATSAYFVYPVAPGLVEASALFAHMAPRCGVTSIVNMSQKPARRDAVSNSMRAHWLAERVFNWSPVPVTHIRATLFAEWLTIDPKSVAHDNVLRLPMGNGRHAPVSTRDLAYVIAGILEDPEPHRDTTYPVYGPVEMDHQEIAGVMSEVLGRTIRYEPVDDADFEANLRRLGWPDYLVQHLSQVVVDYRNNMFVGANDVVEKIGKTEPTTVASFVESNRDILSRN